MSTLLKRYVALSNAKTPLVLPMSALKDILDKIDELTTLKTDWNSSLSDRPALPLVA